MNEEELAAAIRKLIDANSTAQGLGELNACTLAVDVLDGLLTGYEMRIDELDGESDSV